MGSAALRDRWVEPQVAKWVEGVEALAKVAVRFPQAAYTGFAHCLQAEWQYLSRCVPAVGPLLAPIEDAIHDKLIPALLGGMPDRPSRDDFRRLVAGSVRFGGMAVRRPVESAARARACSMNAGTVLTASLLAGGGLNTAEHRRQVQGAATAAREAREHEEELFRQQLAHHRSLRKDRKRLRRIPKSGAWLSILPSRWHGTLLSCDEWRDNIRLRYGMEPLRLCSSCDGCGADFTVEHALSCKVGGLVHIRHDDVRDEAGALAAMAFQKSAVSYEPPIYSGTGVRASQMAPGDGNDGDRGDVLVHGLWKRGEDAILDTQVVDCDAPSRRSYMDSEKILESCARVKKLKYLQPCIERRRSFTPLIYSVDGMAGREAQAFEKRIAHLLAEKWERHYSVLRGFVRGRMALAVVRSNTLLLRGSRMRKSARFAGQDGAALSGLGHVRD